MINKLNDVKGGLTNTTAKQVLDDAYWSTYGLYDGVNPDHPLASITIKPREAVMPVHPVFNLQRRYAKYAPTFSELSITFDDLLYNPRWLVDEWFIIATEMAEKRGTIAAEVERQLNGGK